MNLTRRKFLASGLAGAALAGAALSAPFIKRRRIRRFSGAIVGANAPAGHLARDGTPPAPSSVEQTGAVIVGGGISGLAAARRFTRAGFDDFVMLDLEASPGGTVLLPRLHVRAA